MAGTFDLPMFLMQTSYKKIHKYDAEKIIFLHFSLFDQKYVLYLTEHIS